MGTGLVDDECKGGGISTVAANVLTLNTLWSFKITLLSSELMLQLTSLTRK